MTTATYPTCPGCCQPRQRGASLLARIGRASENVALGFLALRTRSLLSRPAVRDLLGILEDVVKVAIKRTAEGSATPDEERFADVLGPLVNARDHLRARHIIVDSVCAELRSGEQDLEDSPHPVLDVIGQLAERADDIEDAAIRAQFDNLLEHLHDQRDALEGEATRVPADLRYHSARIVVERATFAWMKDGLDNLKADATERFVEAVSGGGPAPQPPGVEVPDATDD